jgi:hypothetical protein
VLLLKSEVKWDRNPEFKFIICGILDSDFAKDLEIRKIMSVNSTFMCGVPVIKCSTMQLWRFPLWKHNCLLL